jgi:NitT/TauT family transport system permease protein
MSSLLARQCAMSTRDDRGSSPGSIVISALTDRRVLAPILLASAVLAGWEFLVRYNHVPTYILPGPFLVIKTMITDWGTLSGALVVTLSITLAALVAAAAVGGLLAILFSQSPWMEASLFPFAVALQVTPVVSIAPLIIIWVDNTRIALLICAWLVAFFPVLSNTTVGLNSADHNLRDLFALYRASRWQTLWHLRVPAAMPYFLAGLRISGGLSLIGAIVAEFVAGTGGTQSGLAFRILESGYQMNMPRMFAALAMISACGVVIFLFLTLLSHLLLRHWHESAVKREQ